MSLSHVHVLDNDNICAVLPGIDCDSDVGIAYHGNIDKSDDD